MPYASPPSSTALVTDADRATYAADGVVCIRGLLAPQWITHMRGAIARAMATPSVLARNAAAEGGRSGLFHNEVFLWKNHEGFLHFIRESPIAEAAAQLLGTRELRLYNDHLLVKEPGTDAPTPWHQDGVYFQLDGEQIVSAWVGFDPVRRETGAMSFVKGSHRARRMYRPVAFATGAATDSDAFDGAMPEIEGDPAAYPTVCYEMEPGDVTFHHALTIHGAKGNTSTSMRRRGYSIRMAGDDVRWKDRKYSSTKIQGEGVRNGDPLGGPSFPLLWPHAAPSPGAAS